MQYIWIDGEMQVMQPFFMYFYINRSINHAVWLGMKQMNRSLDTSSKFFFVYKFKKPGNYDLL